jgi:hypothetical protein
MAPWQLQRHRPARQCLGTVYGRRNIKGAGGGFHTAEHRAPLAALCATKEARAPSVPMWGRAAGASDVEPREAVDLFFSRLSGGVHYAALFPTGRLPLASTRSEVPFGWVDVGIIGRPRFISLLHSKGFHLGLVHCVAGTQLLLSEMLVYRPQGEEFGVCVGSCRGLSSTLADHPTWVAGQNPVHRLSMLAKEIDSSPERIIVFSRARSHRTEIFQRAIRAILVDLPTGTDVTRTQYFDGLLGANEHCTGIVGLHGYGCGRRRQRRAWSGQNVD